MVEGPGCTLNGEKIRSKVQKGQKVTEICGGTKPAVKNETHGSAFRSFSGCQFTGVDTLGKELFMYFGQRALRVHFGMDGAMHPVHPSDRKDRNGKLPELEIKLTNDMICFYDTTVEIRLAEACERKVRAMECVDVCSPKFSFSQADELVKREGSRLLCDVLLDQAILPGVGNIIKNEALFDSGLHPAVKVSQLTDGQVHHLVKMTRDFTLLFYKCRKFGSPLHKHFKVYKRTNCGQCDGKITVCRLGENGRMTYFCRSCQSGDPSQVNFSKLPHRNSLIGWVCRDGMGSRDHVTKKEEEEWACALCTLINQPGAKRCDACLTPRPEITKGEVKEDSSSFFTDLIKYPCNAFAKPYDEMKVNRKTVFGTSTLVFTDFSEKPPPVCPPLTSGSSNVNSLATEAHLNKHNFSQGKAAPNYASGSSRRKSSELSSGEFTASYSQPEKKMRIDHRPFHGNKPQTGNSNFTWYPRTDGTDVRAQTPPSNPRCSGHGRPCVLRIVRKEGVNKGRQFCVCSLPKESQCEFFEWADLHFPACEHGKRCLRRTVLKLGPNNGRNFYVCPLGVGKQCEFFQWVENGPGQ